MKTACLPLLALLALGAGPAARAESAAPTQPPAGAPAAAPSEQEVEAARAAIGAVDLARLNEDADYARVILAHLDLLDRVITEQRVRVAIDTLRLIALRTAGDHARIRTIVDRVLADRSNDAALYTSAWWAALSIPDTARAVAVIDRASRAVPGVGWADLRESIGPQVPGYLLGELERDHQDADRLRLAEALFRIGWPGGGDLERSNDLRLILLKYRIGQGDGRGAAEMATGLTDPASVLPLLVQRRYDSLFGTDADRLARLRQAIAEYDQLTLDALGGDPQLGPVYDRARFLRSLGRDREALALLEPFTRDVPATVAADYRGMWAVNEAAYALLALDRANEAVALMERLIALPVADNTDLIGPYINHAIILSEAGRHEEALAHGTRLDREFSDFASDYGKMLIVSRIVCALASLHRDAEAGPMLARLRAGSDANPGHLREALLCLGDTEAAEALVIRQLESDDPESVLLSFQDYQLGRDREARPDPEHDRLMSLRDRPAVRRALERVGRVLPLPLARTL